MQAYQVLVLVILVQLVRLLLQRKITTLQVHRDANKREGTGAKGQSYHGRLGRVCTGWGAGPFGITRIKQDLLPCIASNVKRQGAGRCIAYWMLCVGCFAVEGSPEASRYRHVRIFAVQRNGLLHAGPQKVAAQPHAAQPRLPSEARKLLPRGVRTRPSVFRI
jgi:hypothetical protein